MFKNSKVLFALFAIGIACARDANALWGIFGTKKETTQPSKKIEKNEEKPWTYVLTVNSENKIKILKKKVIEDCEQDVVTESTEPVDFNIDKCEKNIKKSISIDGIDIKGTKFVLAENFENKDKNKEYAFDTLKPIDVTTDGSAWEQYKKQILQCWKRNSWQLNPQNGQEAYVFCMHNGNVHRLDHADDDTCVSWGEAASTYALTYLGKSEWDIHGANAGIPDSVNITIVKYANLPIDYKWTNIGNLEKDKQIIGRNKSGKEKGSVENFDNFHECITGFGKEEEVKNEEEIKKQVKVDEVIELEKSAKEDKEVDNNTSAIATNSSIMSNSSVTNISNVSNKEETKVTENKKVEEIKVKNKNQNNSYDADTEDEEEEEEDDDSGSEFTVEDNKNSKYLVGGEIPKDSFVLIRFDNEGLHYLYKTDDKFLSPFLSDKNILKKFKTCPTKKSLQDKKPEASYLFTQENVAIDGYQWCHFFNDGIMWEKLEHNKGIISALTDFGIGTNGNVKIFYKQLISESEENKKNIKNFVSGIIGNVTNKKTNLPPNNIKNKSEIKNQMKKEFGNIVNSKDNSQQQEEKDVNVTDNIFERIDNKIENKVENLVKSDEIKHEEIKIENKINETKEKHVYVTTDKNGLIYILLKNNAQKINPELEDLTTKFKTKPVKKLTRYNTTWYRVASKDDVPQGYNWAYLEDRQAEFKLYMQDILSKDNTEATKSQWHMPWGSIKSFLVSAVLGFFDGFRRDKFDNMFEHKTANTIINSRLFLPTAVTLGSYKINQNKPFAAAAFTGCFAGQAAYEYGKKFLANINVIDDE